MSTLALSLPALEARPANPPETRPSRVVQWLAEIERMDPLGAARLAGDALAAINRVAMGDSRRYQLAEAHWNSAAKLWPGLERQFSRASHPLSGASLDAAKAALSLSAELATAYKHLLAREADKRLPLRGPRFMLALVHRCLQASGRLLHNSYLAYAPVPPRTWHDAHLVYAFARQRNLHRQPVVDDEGDTTPERTYLQSLLLALANPYGFHPGQVDDVVRYLREHASLAKLTDIAPVHRMAKAVAIVPVGHDFPPFSANKGGTLDGSKLFLLTFDLAFDLQERIRALDAAAMTTADGDGDPTARARHSALLSRLLRQWALPPARQFNRLPSRARVVMCTGLQSAWQFSGGTQVVASGPQGVPALSACQVVNQTPAGYALRQTDLHAAPLRINELIALRIEGRGGVQLAIVRWLRNTLRGASLEFGCEILSDAPEAAIASADELAVPTPVVVLPGDDPAIAQNAAPAQLVVPAGTFELEQGLPLRRGDASTFAVLTKPVDRGPGFEIYEYVQME